MTFHIVHSSKISTDRNVSKKKLKMFYFKKFFRPITFYKMFFLWKIFHNCLSLPFSGFGNNSDSNAAAAGFNAAPGASAFNTGGFGGATNSFGNIGSVEASTGYGGTQANAMGNSGFFRNSGDGAFVSQSGGVGNQAVQNYTNVVNFNFGTSISQEGNQ